MSIQRRTTRFVRTRRGAGIHRLECHWGRHGKPWLWADNKSTEELRRWCQSLGYHPCYHCDPLEYGK